jgi:hypothetical protein
VSAEADFIGPIKPPDSDGPVVDFREQEMAWPDPPGAPSNHGVLPIKDEESSADEGRELLEAMADDVSAPLDQRIKAWHALAKRRARPAHRPARSAPLQFTRNVLLVEKVNELREHMGGSTVTLAAVFEEIDRLGWTGADIFGHLASSKKTSTTGTWSGRTVEKRYFAASARLKANLTPVSKTSAK